MSGPETPRHVPIDELINRSSLGTDGARRLRARARPEDVDVVHLLNRAVHGDADAMAELEHRGELPTDQPTHLAEATLLRMVIESERAGKEGAMLIADQYRRQHQQKVKSQTDALKKAADLRRKEAEKWATAAKAQAAAASTKSPTTARSKIREAERAIGAANKCAKDAAKQETQAAGYAAAAADLQNKIVKADQAAAQRAERQRKTAQRAADQAAAAERRRVEQRIDSTEQKADRALRELSAPRAAMLRILMLGASPQGDLRIGREQSKIRRAVEAATHGGQVVLDIRTSATTDDLLDGITKFRPHVVHFSGHSGDEVIGFEEDVNEHHAGVVVTANALASACAATDDPPTLIVLNSCESAGTADALVERFAPLAIGMLGEIDDTDAILYATQLYAAIANGQSVNSAHLSGQAAVELAGGEHELPYFAVAADVDAAAVKLVQAPG